MAYTARQLITRSWYLSGIVSRELESVSGDQLNDGLRMLNEFLAVKTIDHRLIPYYTKYNFTATVGIEKYFIPKLISGQTLTFTLSNVRYALNNVGRSEYFSTPRANNISSLPYQYHYERSLDGSDLYIYFLPQQNYDFELYGKFSLDEILDLEQDLSLTLDKFYLEYLRYGLADYMCQDYNISFQKNNDDYLKGLEKQLFDTSPIDFSINKSSILQGSNNSDIYGQVNIGRGWTT